VPCAHAGVLFVSATLLPSSTVISSFCFCISNFCTILSLHRKKRLTSTSAKFIWNQSHQAAKLPSISQIGQPLWAHFLFCKVRWENRWEKSLRKCRHAAGLKLRTWRLIVYWRSYVRNTWQTDSFHVSQKSQSSHWRILRSSWRIRAFDNLLDSTCELLDECEDGWENRSLRKWFNKLAEIIIECQNLHTIWVKSSFRIYCKSWICLFIQRVAKIWRSFFSEKSETVKLCLPLPCWHCQTRSS
jgi:hypothetical protein